MDTRLEVNIYVDKITEDNFDKFWNCLDTMFYELDMIDECDNYDIYNTALTYSHGLIGFSDAPPIKNANGDYLYIWDAYKSMNKEIRDIVDETIGKLYCGDVYDEELMQDYFDEYCKIHLEKYGKEFKFNRTIKERNLDLDNKESGKTEIKYNVVTKESSFVIADDCTFTEAMVIIREMEIIDIKDGTFEPDFYEIVEAAIN